MPAPEKPKNEAERLKALKSYGILDTIYEKAYDDLVNLAAQICDTPMAVVTLLDEDRQWFKAQVGMGDMQETPREVSFCGHAILKKGLMEVPDAKNDSRFSDNKFVRGKDGIRFYAGSPLTSSDGYRLGTLCVIDRIPRRLTAAQKAFLKVLTHQVEVLLELRKATAEMSKKEKQIQSFEQDRKDFTTALLSIKKPIFQIEVNAQKLITEKNLANAGKLAEEIKKNCFAATKLTDELLAKTLHALQEEEKAKKAS